MTKVELPSNVVNTITLDGDGKRRSIEDSAGLRNVIWDAENIVAETDSGNSTVAQYTLAPQAYGELISQRRSGATSFHHFDALGSTNKLSDSGENALVEYLYRAFGQQTIVSGSSANPFTWVGRLGYYRQPDASDYWIRARIMKPAIARWLTRDPLRSFEMSYHQTLATRFAALRQLSGVSLHPLNYAEYLYAGNNPLTMIDPTGLVPGSTCNCLALYKQCMEAAGWRQFLCQVLCGLGIGFPGVIWGAICIALVLRTLSALILVACAGIEIGAAILFVICWRACERQFAADEKKCQKIYDDCTHQ